MGGWKRFVGITRSFLGFRRAITLAKRFPAVWVPRLNLSIDRSTRLSRASSITSTDSRRFSKEESTIERGPGWKSRRFPARSKVFIGNHERRIWESRRGSTAQPWLPCRDNSRTGPSWLLRRMLCLRFFWKVLICYWIVCILQLWILGII